MDKAINNASIDMGKKDEIWVLDIILFRGLLCNMSKQYLYLVHIMGYARKLRINKYYVILFSAACLAVDLNGGWAILKDVKDIKDVENLMVSKNDTQWA